MTTTPPPPSRARTPPTPLHGAKHDTYEPFSPRRSGRIHTKQTTHSSPSALDSPSRGRHSTTRVAAATPGQSRISHRNSTHTFSPPLSPTSPAQRRRADTALDSASRKRTKPSIAVTYPGSDDELINDAAALSRPGAMFPTPAKTPRKRHAQADSALATTARVLFPGRTMHPDDVIPSPRRSRKQSKKAAFSLESFAEACENGGEKIEIYTDSKERVPEMDESEDNPFITRANTRAGLSRPTRKTKNGMSRSVDQAVENGEGMVYVFRGKKVFRRFDADANDEDDSMDDLGEDEEVVTERDVRKTARGRTTKRFTRSTIKPRLLFPPAAATPELDAEEEAATDIEDELAMDVATTAASDFSATPKKQAYRLATPPTTVRKNRRGAALTPDSSPIGPSADTFADELAPAGPAKRSPFDSWQRTKPHARTASGKRQAESLEKHASPKRSRNVTQT